MVERLPVQNSTEPLKGAQQELRYLVPKHPAHSCCGAHQRSWIAGALLHKASPLGW